MTRTECTAARERLLEAELDEIRSSASGLGQHFETCARCRAAAAALLEGYAELDAGLDTLAHLQKKRSMRAWFLVPVPLAAAAVLALLLLTGRGERPVVPPTLLARLMFPAEPVVTTPPGKQAMILDKGDLTVVWLY